MKKRMLVIAVAVTVFAVAIIGGTMAFLTAEHGERNTMTVGEVEIEQHEEQRIFLNGQYTEGSTRFNSDNAPAIIPAIYDVDEQGNPYYPYDGEIRLGNNREYNIWNETISGEIDKFVYVQNHGTVDAYARTIIAFEDKVLTNGKYLTEYLHTLWGDVNTLGSDVNATWNMNSGEPFPADKDIVWLMTSDTEFLTIDIPDDPSNLYSPKTTFTIAVALYDQPIPANTNSGDSFSEPSLMQLWLDPTVPDEWFQAVGDKYDIICLSQAVQANFNNAVQAFDAAFPLSTENLIDWLENVGY